MSDDDRVLSQDEIDALLAKSLSRGEAAAAKASAPAVQQVKVSADPPPSKVVAQQPKAPPPPPPKVEAQQPKAPPPPKAAAAPAPQPAAPSGPTPEQVANLCRQVIAEETKDLHKTVIELTIKVNQLTTAVQKMDQLEGKIDQLTATVKSSPKAIRTLEARIGEIYGLLETIQQNSEEGRIHDEFQCVNCHARNLVAIHVKCTNCGMENWMGWFPEEKGK